VHLHVHTQYSLLDGQASVSGLVDKAIKDGMRGMAVTDHGNMMGIKEFFNYTNKKNAPIKKKIAELKALLRKAEQGAGQPANPTAEAEAETPVDADALRAQIEEEKSKLFKPIFGCEMYVAPRSMQQKTKELDAHPFHLIVLAKNETGYHNLIKLVSHSWTDGFYSKPRTDHEELEKYREGLIVCSACIAGEVPRRILSKDISGAEEIIQWYKRVFGDDYYLELQRHQVTDPNQRANRETYELQKIANAELIRLAQKHGVKLICSNDVHFVDAENAEAHDRLLCLGTNSDLNDPKRMLYSKQEWFKTRQEMNAIFADVPEALRNTCEICDKVETYSIDHAPIMPNFAIPTWFGTEESYRQKFTEQQLFDEFTHDENGNEVLSPDEAAHKIDVLGGTQKLYRLKLEADYLGHLTFEGAKKIYGEPLPDEVVERIRFELHVMKTMGFPGYFLIVQDYINAARKELDVSVGPGRGSAAGSEVAYCLGITKIDPIKYDLLFERFLNPDRISLPDIDVDFDDDGRGKVISWVTQKYGEERVTHIITYGTMATKLAIKDVARVQKIPLDIVNRWCKAIPDTLPSDKDGNPRKMNLKNAIACIPELAEAANSTEPTIHDTIEYAKMLEGNVRNTGVHACGIIICRDDVSDWVPVSTAEDKATGERLRCTQYEGSVIEDTGLIKMDFLGLKNLSIIKECVANIKNSLGIDLDVDKLCIDDPATYRLYCDGRTIGTFQFESAGMQKHLRELQPDTFEDLIAMNALYRPGPMDYIPDFINRKQGRAPVEYDIPCMEKYLKDTYGITVYQEQVMLLSRQLASFTRGESDTLRKAMGKKQRDKLDKLKPKFIKQGSANGHDPQILEKIWADWEKFASYAFNKSHATCYSWVAYQTAYLKANFPSEYMAASMSRNLSDIKEITKLMNECRAIGVKCLGPDINHSRQKFSVGEDGNIRFGLGAVKGIGEVAVEAIVKERDTNGPYTSIFDLVHRVSVNTIKRNGLECLALSGALDCFSNEITREQMVAKNERGETFLDVLVRYGNSYQQAVQEAQNSLFGSLDQVEVSTPPIPEAERWNALERLTREKELVGIYLSAHPLDDYYVILQNRPHGVCTTQMTDISDLDAMPEGDIVFGGIVTNVRTGVTNKGKGYGVVTIEDYSGTGELALFGQEWAKWQSHLSTGNSLLIHARISPRNFDPSRHELRIGKIDFLSDVKDDIIQRLTITATADDITESTALTLSRITRENPGRAQLIVQLVDNDGEMVTLTSRACQVSVNKNLISFMESQPGLHYAIN
ncbi:MAG: DNA polymerase III subunit alpha, partial [Bacteroidaceae bacterium]|nr:DNA polymerase III subunit alpha [Bacteroidaceae bacterium]